MQAACGLRPRVRRSFRGHKRHISCDHITWWAERLNNDCSEVHYINYVIAKSKDTCKGKLSKTILLGTYVSSEMSERTGRQEWPTVGQVSNKDAIGVLPSTLQNLKRWCMGILLDGEFLQKQLRHSKNTFNPFMTIHSKASIIVMILIRTQRL